MINTRLENDFGAWPRARQVLPPSGAKRVVLLNMLRGWVQKLWPYLVVGILVPGGLVLVLTHLLYRRRRLVSSRQANTVDGRSLAR